MHIGLDLDKWKSAKKKNIIFLSQKMIFSMIFIENIKMKIY